MITTKDGQLVFECEACGQPVAGDDGWMHIDLGEARRVERAKADWNERNPGSSISGSAILSYPSPARWQVHHSACDPDHDDHGCYWFYVGRCATWPQLVGWTAHLMGKTWFPHTNWSRVLERIGDR